MGDALVAGVSLVVAAGGAGESVWATAAIAAAAAILGSLFGGFMTYLANAKFEERRRRTRAAIRRKVKVYVPLRAELERMKEAMAKQDHLFKGIVRREPYADRGDDPRTHFYIWDQLVGDGRADTAVSPRVERRYEALSATVTEFNAALEQGDKVTAARIRACLREAGLEAQPDLDGMFIMFMLSSLNEGMESLGLDRDDDAVQRLVRQVDDAVDVNEAGDEVARLERRLSEDIDETLATLQASIEQIARKYEREQPDD